MADSGKRMPKTTANLRWKPPKIMRLVDGNVKFIADGASNYKPDNKWMDWNDYVLQHMAGSIDYLSVHRYCQKVLNGRHEASPA